MPAASGAPDSKEVQIIDIEALLAFIAGGPPPISPGLSVLMNGGSRRSGAAALTRACCCLAFLAAVGMPPASARRALVKHSSGPALPLDRYDWHITFRKVSARLPLGRAPPGERRAAQESWRITTRIC